MKNSKNKSEPSINRTRTNNFMILKIKQINMKKKSDKRRILLKSSKRPKSKTKFKGLFKF